MNGNKQRQYHFQVGYIHVGVVTLVSRLGNTKKVVLSRCCFLINMTTGIKFLNATDRHE